MKRTQTWVPSFPSERPWKPYSSDHLIIFHPSPNCVRLILNHYWKRGQLLWSDSRGWSNTYRCFLYQPFWVMINVSFLCATFFCVQENVCTHILSFWNITNGGKHCQVWNAWFKSGLDLQRGPLDFQKRCQLVFK